MRDGLIKASDITTPVIDAVESHCAALTDATSESELAAIANALIAAGVVSPPCHYIQHKDGWRPNVNGKLRLWPGKPEPGFAQYKHWKGEE